MKWVGKQHPLETAAEWCAPAILATACGWAATIAAIPVAAAAVATLLVFAAGFAAMKIAGFDRRPGEPGFQPAPVEAVLPDAMEELLLRPEDEVLLLDDPIEDPDPASRVVRLFARQEATPGELMDRIADFLGEGRRSEAGATIATLPTPDVAQPDASAALHEALANIRASLR